MERTSDGQPNKGVWVVWRNRRVEEAGNPLFCLQGGAPESDAVINHLIVSTEYFILSRHKSCFMVIAYQIRLFWKILKLFWKKFSEFCEPSSGGRSADDPAMIGNSQVGSAAWVRATGTDLSGSQCSLRSYANVGATSGVRLRQWRLMPTSWRRRQTSHC